MQRNDLVKVPGDYKYRYEEDIFYARPKNREYESSVDIGQFIFDVDKKGNVVGIEILNASQIFHVPKEALRNLLSMHLEVNVSESKLELKLQLKATMRNGQRSSSLVVEKPTPEFMQPSTLQMALA